MILRRSYFLPENRTLKMFYMQQLRIIYGLLLLCLFWGFVGCRITDKPGSGSPDSDAVKYATGFSVYRMDDYIRIDVRNPWDTTRILQRYLLVDSLFDRIDELPQGTVVQVPLERVIVYNAVHCSMLDRLGVGQRVKGVCEPQYIKSKYVKDGIADGNIENLGESQAPNLEAIIDLTPQAIIASPIKGKNYGGVAKLKTPIIECLDYMETTPLGQAEWIRFLSYFFGKEMLADSLFRDTERSYLEVKSLVSSAQHRPTVFSEMKIGSVWYTAGGRSFVANLFADAGADYMWRDDLSSGSNALSFEAVFDRASEAQFWLIKYNSEVPLTYERLKNDYRPYADFSAFKHRNIFICNTGTNDYYETLPQAPDEILKEFVAIFHPELLPDYTCRFYKKMVE